MPPGVHPGCGRGPCAPPPPPPPLAPPTVLPMAILHESMLHLDVRQGSRAAGRQTQRQTAAAKPVVAGCGSPCMPHACRWISGLLG